MDVVVEVATYGAWAEVGERLRALGFREDPREGAPLCRWLIEDLVVDAMPGLERVLGFTNRWYRQAKKQSEDRDLPEGVRIRAVTAPLFVATKIEAFRSRGRGDFVASHDLGDIIAVFDGRPALVDEIMCGPVQVRRFLASTMKQRLEDADFVAAASGHLTGDLASQARAPVVLNSAERSDRHAFTAAASYRAAPPLGTVLLTPKPLRC